MLLVLSAFAASPGAGLPGPGTTTVAPQPFIVNGTETTAHPNVVALAQQGGNGLFAFCTGTLVHERFVLTAAHCVDSLPATTWVVFGADVDAPDAQVRALGAVSHPAYDPALYIDDIAVVELETPVSDVLPAALADTRPTSAGLGEPLRFVGFGKPDDTSGPTGIKRATDIPLVGWDLQTLFASAPDTNVCQGDSGGPAFRPTDAGWELAGVIAFTLDGCVGGDSGATRVDVHLDWLSTVLPALDLDPEGAVDPADVHADIDRDTGWGAPTLPTRGTYPRGLRCSATAGSRSPMGVFVALLAFVRRRR